jgi:hypothetical protein
MADSIPAPEAGRAIPLEVIPEELQERVRADSPAAMKNALARAMVPLDPGPLLTVLAYLAGDPDPRIAEVARRTPNELPESLVRTVLADAATSPQVLAWYGRVFASKKAYVEAVLLNSATPDETFRFLASALHDPDLLDIIALNQVRCLRYTEIIEGLYYNPDTRMASIGRVIDLAVRTGVSLSHLRGFREIEAAFAAEGIKGPQAPLSAPPDEQKIEEALAEGPIFEDGAVDDETFSNILRAHYQDLGDVAAEDIEDVKEQSRALYNQVKEMSIPQKLRLAIVGNAAARRLLIRDPRKQVCMAVLGNPRMTEKEVATFAAQKSIDEDVVRAIARNRDWTRLYSTRLSLVRNPKTPANTAISFIATLHDKDLKQLSKDKEIPGYVQKFAKEAILKREKRKGGN